MRLQTLRGIYDADGPLATVYLESGAPGEDAEQQIRLRWDALRRQLAEDGADEELLAALDDALIVEDIGEVQADGRVLVAGPGGVLLNEAWDAATGAGDSAHLTDEPELGAYVRERARSVRLLVAVADRQGAVVRREVAVDDREHGAGAEQVVRPQSDESVHKPRGQALSHNQIQRRADEAVRQNAQGVAEHLESVTRKWQPDVLVLAGEVQGRTAVRGELSKALTDIHQEVEAGGVGDDGAEEALTDALRDLASRVAAERAQQHTERFEEAKARGRTAEGAEAVARAADIGAVDTVFFGDGDTASNEGALLAAGARTDADAEVLDSAVTDGVAAVLRFEAPDEIPKTST